MRRKKTCARARRFARSVLLYTPSDNWLLSEKMAATAEAYKSSWTSVQGKEVNRINQQDDELCI